MILETKLMNLHLNQESSVSLFELWVEMDEDPLSMGAFPLSEFVDETLIEACTKFDLTFLDILEDPFRYDSSVVAPILANVIEELVSNTNTYLPPDSHLIPFFLRIIRESTQNGLVELAVRGLKITLTDNFAGLEIAICEDIAFLIHSLFDGDNLAIGFSLIAACASSSRGVQYIEELFPLDTLRQKLNGQIPSDLMSGVACVLEEYTKYLPQISSDLMEWVIKTASHFCMATINTQIWEHSLYTIGYVLTMDGKVKNPLKLSAIVNSGLCNDNPQIAKAALFTLAALIEQFPDACYANIKGAIGLMSASVLDVQLASVTFLAKLLTFGIERPNFISLLPIDAVVKALASLVHVGFVESKRAAVGVILTCIRFLPFEQTVRLFSDTALDDYIELLTCNLAVDEMECIVHILYLAVNEAFAGVQFNHFKRICIDRKLSSKLEGMMSTANSGVMQKVEFILSMISP